MPRSVAHLTRVLPMSTNKLWLSCVDAHRDFAGDEASHARGCLDQQCAMSVDAARHAARDFAGVFHAHFAIAQRVALVPVVQVRREAVARKPFERGDRGAESSAATIALRSGTGAQCARMSSAVLPVAFTASRASSSSATLRPIPTTTCTGPPDSARISMRMPPSLPSPVTRSLGHFSVTPGTPSAVSAFTAQSPTTSDSADRSAGMSAYCHAERQADGAPGRRDPAAAAPAAPAGLVFGQHHRGGACRRRQRL